MASATLIEAIDRLSDVAESLFHQPLNSELAALWVVGFSLPVTLFLVSYMVGVLVNFWRR